MKKILLTCSIIVLVLTLNAQHNHEEPSNFVNKEISVIYLGHSGWALKTNNNFLIFDYQEKYGTKLENQTAKNLLSGYISPAEIKDYNVYVFTSHEHIDHYDPVILNWDKDLENITYFFGWDFSSDEKYHCLKAPRAGYKDEIIEVSTVNSHHSGVPESAFLVKIDGLVIYHNGDYKGDDYKKDFRYLKTKTEKIDIAFSNCDPDENSQMFLQAMLLMKQFGIKHFFPMHSRNEKEQFRKLAKMYEDNGVQTKMNCAETKGDKFILKLK